MKLETVIKSHLESFPPEARFSVIAFELWGNAREGFDCNDAWKIARDISADEVPAVARGRWEAFKVNYLPKARVSDVSDASCDSGGDILLEVDCVPFLTIRPL